MRLFDPYCEGVCWLFMLSEIFSQHDLGFLAPLEEKVTANQNKVILITITVL